MAAVSSTTNGTTIPISKFNHKEREESFEQIISDLCGAIVLERGPEKIKELSERCSLETALLAVAAKGKSYAMRILLDGGANPDATTPSGRPALHVVIEASELEEKERIHALAMDVVDHVITGEDPSFSSLLTFRSKIKPGSAEPVRTLLERGANPDLQDMLGWTPLHKAVTFGSLEMVRALLEVGANPNLKESGDQVTPLHVAATISEEEVVIALLESKANPNSTDKNLDTPLHYAIQGLKSEVVGILLRSGADPYAIDVYGYTPLRYLSESSTNTKAPILEAYLNALPKDRVKETILFDVYSVVKSMTIEERKEAIGVIASFIRTHELSEPADFLEDMRDLDPSFVGILREAFTR